MIDIELEARSIRLADIIAKICCGVLAIFVLFLLITSMIFSLGGDAPSLFGQNVYIVDTEAFEIINKGTAVITSKVPFEEIQPGNIVIYEGREGKAALAEIQLADYIEGVYSFTALSEIGAELTLSQGQIIGKAMQYSNFFGGLIRFAKSPAGVMLLAVIPCFLILGYELFKSIISRLRGEPQITPVKKQDEIPTYIPRPKVTQAVSAYRDVQNSQNDEATSQNKGYGNIDDLFAKVPPIKDGFDNKNDDDFPLFRSPKSPPKPQPVPQPKNQMPLSQKRLNEVMAETKPRIRTEPQQKPQAPQNSLNDTMTRTTELDKQARTAINNTTSYAENLKHFTPRKQANATRLTSTQAIPRLDDLLRDEADSDDTRYDINNILSSFDKTRKE